MDVGGGGIKIDQGISMYAELVDSFGLNRSIKA